MCIICIHQDDIQPIINIKNLHCFECKQIKSIPKEMIDLEVLFCNNTNIKIIPSTLVLLKILNINKCNIKSIPSTLNNIEILYCNDTLIESIPDSFNKLEELHCERTSIKYLNNNYIRIINVIDCKNLLAINTKYKRIYGLRTCNSVIDLKKIKEKNSKINEAIIKEMYNPKRIEKFLLKNKDIENIYN